MEGWLNWKMEEITRTDSIPNVGRSLITICEGAKTGYEPRNSQDKNFTAANNVLMFS